MVEAIGLIGGGNTCFSLDETHVSLSDQNGRVSRQNSGVHTWGRSGGGFADSCVFESDRWRGASVKVREGIHFDGKIRFLINQGQTKCTLTFQ